MIGLGVIAKVGNSLALVSIKEPRKVLKGFIEGFVFKRGDNRFTLDLIVVVVSQIAAQDHFPAAVERKL